jgi:hypothetical protein
METMMGRVLVVEAVTTLGIYGHVIGNGHFDAVERVQSLLINTSDWLAAAAIDRGRLFRRVNKVGRTWGDGMTVKAVCP